MPCASPDTVNFRPCGGFERGGGAGPSAPLYLIKGSVGKWYPSLRGAERRSNPAGGWRGQYIFSHRRPRSRPPPSSAKIYTVPALDALDDQGDALADADAHGAQGIAAAAAVELLGGGEGEAGARHAAR